MKRLYYISMMYRSNDLDNFTDMAGPMTLEELRTVPEGDMNEPGFFVRWEDFEECRIARERKPVFAGRMYFFRDAGLDETVRYAMDQWRQSHPGQGCTIMVSKEMLQSAEAYNTEDGLKVTVVAGTCPPMHFILGRYE